MNCHGPRATRGRWRGRKLSGPVLPFDPLEMSSEVDVAAPAFVGVALVGSMKVRPHLKVSSYMRKDSMHHRLDLFAQRDVTPATPYSQTTKYLRSVSPSRSPAGQIAAKSSVLIAGAQVIRRGPRASRGHSGLNVSGEERGESLCIARSPGGLYFILRVQCNGPPPHRRS
jgi:hypothetical protein